MAQNLDSMVISDEMYENIKEAFLILNDAAEKARKKKETFDNMSDEERRQQINISNAWGTYGWIKPLKMPSTCFEIIPSTKEEADNRAIEYCKGINMEKEWEYTRTEKWYKDFDNDFEEAVVAFNSKMYKSCSLMLVSIIDGSLIRFQKGNENVEVCLSAINNFQSNVFQKTIIEEWLDSKCDLSGLNRALKKVFEPVEFLKSDSDIINRNLLVHGAMKRKVTEVDCIQLFLIYRELSAMILYYACSQKKE